MTADVTLSGSWPSYRMCVDSHLACHGNMWRHLGSLIITLNLNAAIMWKPWESSSRNAAAK